jgi:replicative DNA helicase
MKLSLPIYQLKRKAKLLSRKDSIPLCEALDHVARQEGFGSWSLLAAKVSEMSPASKLFSRLNPGDMVLVGARPGQGKTLMSLELCVEAMKAGHRSAFFTLEYTENHLLECFRSIGCEWHRFEKQFELDCSDHISADYIIRKLEQAPRGTLLVIDYLQLLDQRREHPELATQVQLLQAFARDRELIIVFISQIDRKYNPATKSCPDAADVRLPNPIDLSLFNKMCFLNGSDIQLKMAR